MWLWVCSTFEDFFRVGERGLGRVYNVGNRPVRFYMLYPLHPLFPLFLDARLRIIDHNKAKYISKYITELRKITREESKDLLHICRFITISKNCLDNSLVSLAKQYNDIRLSVQTHKGQLN